MWHEICIQLWHIYFSNGFFFNEFRKMCAQKKCKLLLTANHIMTCGKNMRINKIMSLIKNTYVEATGTVYGKTRVYSNRPHEPSPSNLRMGIAPTVRLHSNTYFDVACLQSRDFSNLFFLGEKKKHQRNYVFACRLSSAISCLLNGNWQRWKKDWVVYFLPGTSVTNDGRMRIGVF